jgi:hypothetical protein
VVGSADGRRLTLTTHNQIWFLRNAPNCSSPSLRSSLEIFPVKWNTLGSYYGSFPARGFRASTPNS